MTNLYEAKATVTMRVEANDMREARREIREMVKTLRNAATDGIVIDVVENDRSTFDVKMI